MTGEMGQGHLIGSGGALLRMRFSMLLACALEAVVKQNCEAEEFRKSTLSLVEDAIESLDYWKLQAAMQAVIGASMKF